MLATFAVTLFLLSALAPASAHFTLGELDGTKTRGVKYDGPYTGQYSGTGDATHRKGPLGYVFPGAGLWSESLYGGPWKWGYGYFPGADQIQGYDRLRLGLHTGGSHYSPWESILTSVDTIWDGKSEYESKGDLIFALNFSNPDGTGGDGKSFSSWVIYIPAATDAYGRYTGEGFIPPVDWAKGDTSNIVASFTNDYLQITVGKADDKDPFAPGWYWIYVRPDSQALDGQSIYFPSGTDPVTNRPYDRWYYVRVNGLTAPTVAGKYIFKMFLNETWPTRANAYVDQTPAPGGLLGGGTYPMPAENWPVLVVKGEVDPAYIYGAVRFGGHNPQLYGKPVNLAGKVVAEGEAIDPYKWPSIVKTGRKVKAVAYFNETAHGRYALEGVAPGISTVKASCAGYPEDAEWEITVGPGQSYSHDFYLTPGAVIWGRIYSKCGLGTIPWPVVGTAANAWLPLDNPGSKALGPPITVEISDLKDNVVTRSPVNLTYRPFTSYAVGNVRWDWRTDYVTTVFTPKAVAFPWSYRTDDDINWGSEYPAPYAEDWFLTRNAVPNGVGPQQYWWTPGGSTGPFNFTFGQEGWFGAPTEFSGYVPQAYATWVNGLLPGQYKVKAYVNGYVQTEDYIVTVPAAEFPGNIQVEMDLRRGSWINVTVHFHHFENSLTTNPFEVPEPGLYMLAEAYDMDGKVKAFNFTFVTKTDLAGNGSSYWIMLNGFGMAGPDNNRWTGAYPFGSGSGDSPEYTAADTVANGKAGVGYKYFQWRYRGWKDYGLMPGTYKIKVYVRGYVQQEDYATTVSLCASPTQMSMHLVKGGSINVTLTPKDWQHPWVEKCWRYGAGSPWNPNGLMYYANPDSGLPGPGYKTNSDNADWGLRVEWHERLIKPFNPTAASPRFRIRFKQPDGAYTEWFRFVYKSTGNGWVDGLGEQKWCSKHLPWDNWPYAQKIIYNGSNYAEVVGPDARQLGTFWRDKWSGFAWTSGGGYYPTALKTGTYGPEAFTFGYVQKMFPTVWVGKGTSSISDIEVDLDEGSLINMTIFFKKQSIFANTTFPMSARARVYNDKGNLVAADTWWYIPANLGVIHWQLGGFSGGWQYDNPVTGSKLALDGWLFGYMEVSRKFFPAGGIPAGTYTIELDFVPLDFDTPTTWVTGLLTGEYGNKDRPYYYPWNHLGPYEQRTVVTVTVPDSGEVSPVFEVDLRGSVKGYAMGYNWKGELRTLGWATVYAGAAPDDGTLTAYTYGGFFDMYIPSGSHTLKMASWGMTTKSFPVSVTEGADLMGIWFEMEQAGIPIPEFPVAGLALVASLAASIYALGRVRRKRA